MLPSGGPWTPLDNNPGCGSSGPPLRLKYSPPSTCPGGGFDGGGRYCGSCNEDYKLVGSFTTANDFVGRFFFTYTGSCFGCSTHSVPVQLYR